MDQLTKAQRIEVKRLQAVGFYNLVEIAVRHPNTEMVHAILSLDMLTRINLACKNRVIVKEVWDYKWIRLENGSVILKKDWLVLCALQEEKA